MAGKKPATAAERSSRGGFTPEEQEAMRDRVRELRARSRGAKPDGESEVLQKIAAMPPKDRAIAERLHALVKTHAPSLTSRTWYGMPAYSRDGQVVCFFQPAQKFKTRYATLGFSDEANLDEGRMWPTTFALQELTGAEEARIAELVRRAVG